MTEIECESKVAPNVPSLVKFYVVNLLLHFLKPLRDAEREFQVQQNFVGVEQENRYQAIIESDEGPYG